jgi:hypothetical protein
VLKFKRKFWRQRVQGELIKTQLIFSKLVEIASHPYVSSDLGDEIILSMSCVVADFNFMFRKLLLKAFNN